MIDLSAPCLIVQGERDAMGRQDEAEVYSMSSAVTLQWIPDGDHSFSPRKRSGRTEEQNLCLAVQHVHSFLASVCC
ncbi:Predicted hydrolase of the alpha/beta-hydrolase old [Synechococcus sp. WH 8103]|nr:Predicted hydrolase of the alpha/beta-hydrolase old [Synechococcus sp. WH 8103]